jgi:hypothetical protein
VKPLFYFLELYSQNPAAGYLFSDGKDHISWIEIPVVPGAVQYLGWRKH